jgi:hypothetical protein
MKARRAVLVAGLIALSAATARPALADVYSVTYTGTASGVDVYGFFGRAGANLNNVAYTSTYTYDPSPYGSAGQGTQADQAVLAGGSSNGNPYPFLSSSITIKGDTYNLVASYFGEQVLQGPPDNPVVISDAYSSSTNGLFNYDDVSSAIIVSLTASQTLLAASGSGGSFTYNSEDLSLTDTQVTVADTSPTPVPEPASFALLAVAACAVAAARGGRLNVARG